MPGADLLATLDRTPTARPNESDDLGQGHTDRRLVPIEMVLLEFLNTLADLLTAGDMRIRLGISGNRWARVMH